MLLVTNTEQKQSEVHTKLKSQNLSLHSLLEQSDDETTPTTESHDNDTPPPTHEPMHSRGSSRTLPGGFVEHSV